VKTRLAVAALVLCSAVVLGSGDAKAAGGDEYKLREAAQYVKDRDGEPIPHVATSEHFALKWGNENNLKYKIDDEYVKSALAYFEHIRDVFINQVKFPLRKSEAGKFKTNIYISETGLKPFLHGYAFGFADPEGYGVFNGDPGIMRPGHGGAAHEMGHAFQSESGGFLNSDYVGWFWECHAQFMAQQVNPTQHLPEVLDTYTDTAHFDWSSTRHHYGSWIFVQYLAEKPGFGMDFVNGLWLKPRLYLDEDPVAKIKRLAGWEHPQRQWADLFGDFAKRNVTFNSYKLGKEYRESLQKVPERNTSRSRAILEEVKGAPGWYRIPCAYAPQQNAYNVIPLTPESKKVKVTFKGFVNRDRKSDWRVTMVVVNDKGGERFSRTWSRGSETVNLKPDEKMIYLVVAATPKVFKHIAFLEDYRSQERFRYEVKIEGAVPRGKDPEKLPWPEGVKGAAHPNGGGFVAATAKAASTAYVGPNARVLDSAEVSDDARMEDYAVVSGNAKVSGNAIVSGHALVTDKATVSGYARVRDYARLYDSTNVEGNARVLDFPRLHSKAHVSENALVKGHCIVWGANLRGDAVFIGGADPGPGVRDCSKGIYTIFVSQEDCDKAASYNGLVAQYDFERPHSFLLKDTFAAGDGFLYGKPSWVRDLDHGLVMEFNGRNQYAELPKYLSDLRDMEISVWVKWHGGEADQRIFDFGSDAGNCMYLTPSGPDGNVAFVMRHNGVEKIVRGKEALPVGYWAHVEVKLSGDACRLLVNSDLAGQHRRLTIKPEDLRATSNFLARGQEGSYFNGQLEDLKVSRMVPEIEQTEE